MVRDEFSRMRAHLFEATEAAGWPSRQEKGWKGVIRTITYDSQASIEAALRRAANGGNDMAAPGITSAHVQAARQAVYGPPEGEGDQEAVEAQKAAESPSEAPEAEPTKAK
jgi:hypothetical protein